MLQLENYDNVDHNNVAVISINHGLFLPRFFILKMTNFFALSLFSTEICLQSGGLTLP